MKDYREEEIVDEERLRSVGQVAGEEQLHEGDDQILRRRLRQTTAHRLFHHSRDRFSAASLDENQIGH